MNLIDKIRNYFNKRNAINEIYDDIKNLDEVFLNKRIEIFNELITPKFAEIGLNNWDGRYLWYSDFNSEGIRHVIKYEVFKYFGGSFSYGNCYDFIPTFDNKNNLKYHKSKSSIVLLDYKKLDGWQDSYENNYTKLPYKISTVNEEKFRKSIFTVLDYNIPIIDKWIKNNNTIDKNIENLLQKISNPDFDYEYVQSSHFDEYIVSFLFAFKNDYENSVKHMKNYFDKVLIKEGIEEKKRVLKEKFPFFENL